MSRTKSAALLAVGAVFGATLVGGSAYAATGGTFVLGRSNAASTPTVLRNSGSGATLSLSAARAGQPPLAVSAGSGKAANLDVDRLDGLDSSQLQRATSAVCRDGYFLDAVGPTGAFSCAGDVLDFVTVEVPTDPRGFARVDCPDGLASVTGGYLLPEGAVAFPTVQKLFADEDDVEGFLARFLLPSGAPYQGTVRMEVSCEGVGPQPATAARTAKTAP